MGLQPFEITTLGRISTDGESNLIVMGGNGSSGTTDRPIQLSVPPNNYGNNNGWFDDVSDGPVTGALMLEDGAKLAIDAPAWVLCGPPKYAPEIVNVVSMYDTMYDIFVRFFGLNPSLYRSGRFQRSYQPNRDSEITPILIRPNLYQYVAAISPFGRTPHAQLPKDTSQEFLQNVESHIRRPRDKNKPGLMPWVAGDNPLSSFQVSNFLTLTPTQYFILSQFAKGIVSTGPPPAIGEGAALDHASLGNCVGGAFCPGIEMTWICRNTTIYAPLPAQPSLSDAFRIRHKDISGGLTLTNGADNDYSAGLEPGDIIKYMAQPWQADFNECSIEPIAGGNYWWWPAQRPYSVYPAGAQTLQLQWTRLSDDDSNEFPDLQMATNWKDVGFILNVGPPGSANFVEIERNQKAISDFSAPLIA
jgi:L-lysine epsilon oxidase C-terminal domain/L-Lysine epsilon oxidase N-terminal